MLELNGIRKSFGKIEVLRGVDLQARAGEVHALLGENGAGKSTLMKILCGILQPSEGTIRIDGKDRRFANYDEAIAAGVGIVFQEFSLIPYLNAVENMFLAREIRGPLRLLNKGAMRKRAAEIMSRLAVDVPLDVPVHRLSVAQQQFVEIAKALSLDARILVLDEPTATLTPSETEHLFKVMRELRRQGVAIIFISHHLEEIFEICDRITVLRDGELIGSCLTSEVDNDRLVEMMVGRRIEASFPPKPQLDPSAESVIEVEELQLKKGGPVSRFALRKGEILGFAGLVGSGRTETVLAMLGAHSASRRKIKVDGVDTRFSGPDEALMRGIGLLPESRKEEGLITSFSILQNISLNNYRKYRKAHWFLDLKKELEHTTKAMAQVQVKAQGPFARVDTLSGGNQQKIFISRWLATAPKLLLLDDPTKGIDLGAKADLFALMRHQADAGATILLYSSEDAEILEYADRILVFNGGRISAELTGADMTSVNMTRAAYGDAA